jgi:hypothetical protein
MMDLLFLEMTYKSWKNFTTRFLSQECNNYILQE